MFSAGSVAFGGSLVNDPALQQILRNVLDECLSRMSSNGDVSRRNDVVVAWHGVEGDTQTWWAELGPVFTAGPPAILPNRVLDPSSFAAPALDPSALLLASVGPTAPSSITLRDVESWGISGGGPAVPASFQTTARPAVATTDAGSAVLAWRRPGDDVICVAAQTGEQWSTPAELASSSHGPAVAVRNNNNQFLVAFKGAENQIYGSLDGGPVTPMHPLDGGMFTSDTPALCWGAGNFWMAWKGVPGDEAIWLARSADGINWTVPQTAQPIDGGILTIAGPGLAVWQRGLVLAWRGVTGNRPYGGRHSLWATLRPCGRPRYSTLPTTPTPDPASAAAKSTRCNTAPLRAAR